MNEEKVYQKFGYNDKIEGYTILMPGIPELGEIGFDLGIYHKLNRIRIYSDRQKDKIRSVI